MSSDRESEVVAALIQSAGRREMPPPGAYQQVAAAATAAWRMKVQKRRRRFVAGALAASLAVVVATAVLIGDLLPSSSRHVARMERIVGTMQIRIDRDERWAALHDETRRLTSGTLLRTSTGSRAGLLLESGVSLRLADSTEVRVDSAAQIHLLHGRVYLDTGSTAAAAAPQIRVVTASGIAWDVGTQFEVLYRHDLYRLRVREGRVLLQRGAGEIGSSAGEQLTIDSAGDYRRTPIARDDPEWHWAQSVAPVPEIEKQPVMVLLEWVARETGKSLKFESPEVERRARTTILHGNIRHLAPLQALTVMLATTDLEHAIPDGRTILIRLRAGRPRQP